MTKIWYNTEDLLYAVVIDTGVQFDKEICEVDIKMLAQLCYRSTWIPDKKQRTTDRTE